MRKVIAVVCEVDFCPRFFALGLPLLGRRVGAMGMSTVRLRALPPPLPPSLPPYLGHYFLSSDAMVLMAHGSI